MRHHLGGYDPFEHAERLGISVVYRRLTTGNGLWVPDLRAIFMQPRLRAVHERTVLGHELGHACLGHRATTPRNERQADRFAALHLIDPVRLADVRATSPDPNVWANEVGVTLDILETWFTLERKGHRWHTENAA